MATDRPRVLLVEDHEVVAEGLRALLSPHFTIIGTIHNGTEVLQAIRAGEPDAVVLDISLPGRNGLDLLPDIHKFWPRLPVVMLTGSADYLVGRTAMVLGALGFLAKDSGGEELEQALRTVLSGRKYFSPRVPPPPSAMHVEALPVSVSNLTPRQLKLLRAIGEGKTTATIAEEWRLSLHTIHFHRKNLRRALGVESEGGLARIAAVFRVREETP